MTQAVSHRPLSTKVWIRFQVILRGIYGGRIGNGTGFSPSTFIVMLCHYHTTHVPYLYLIYVPQTRGYAGSAVGRGTTSRKIAGSIPTGVIGIFHWHNHSGRTMTLGLTQPLTEMSSRNISWG